MTEISDETLRRLLKKDADKVKRYEDWFGELYNIFCDLGFMGDDDD